MTSLSKRRIPHQRLRQRAALLSTLLVFMMMITSVSGASAQDNPNTVFIPFIGGGFALAGGTDIGHDDHGHEEASDETLSDTIHRIILDNVDVADDGTLTVPADVITQMAAQSGIEESEFTAVLDEINATNAEIAASPQDNLAVLAGDVGCINWPSISRGSNGYWTYWAQYFATQNHSQNITVDGSFGTGTENAIRRIQQYARDTGKLACGNYISVDGQVGPQTWALLYYSTTPPASNPPPSTGYRQPTLGSTTGLCAFLSPEKRYGQNSAVRALESAGQTFRFRGEGWIGVGNLSWNGGGYMAPHSSHQVGLDVDLRPMRTDNNQCYNTIQWNWDGYDRGATRQLIYDLRATGNIKLILFNDPQLIAEGLTSYYAGHDNHLHVRYCEFGHSNYRYRC